MFYRGVLHTYDSENKVGTIYIDEQKITVHFNLKDLPNSTIQPQIGERVKCILVEEANDKYAKYIVRLDNKNARTEQSSVQSQSTKLATTSDVLLKEKNRRESTQKSVVTLADEAIAKQNKVIEKNQVKQTAIQNIEKQSAKIKQNIDLNPKTDLNETFKGNEQHQTTEAAHSPQSLQSKLILQNAENELIRKLLSSSLEQSNKNDLEQTTQQIDHGSDLQIAEENNQLKSENPHAESTQEFELNYEALNTKQPNLNESAVQYDEMARDPIGNEEDQNVHFPLVEFELNFEKISDLQNLNIHNEVDQTEENTFEQNDAANAQPAEPKEFELDFGRLAVQQLNSHELGDHKDATGNTITQAYNDGLINEKHENESLKNKNQKDDNEVISEFELNYQVLNSGQVTSETDLQIPVENEKIEQNKQNEALSSEFFNIEFELDFDKLNKDSVIFEGGNSPEQSSEELKKISFEEVELLSNPELAVAEETIVSQKSVVPVLPLANRVHTKNGEYFSTQPNIKKFERWKESMLSASANSTSDKHYFQGQLKVPNPEIVDAIKKKKCVHLTRNKNVNSSKNQFSTVQNKSLKNKKRQKRTKILNFTVMSVIAALVLVNGSMLGYQKFQQYKSEQQAKLTIYMLEQEKKIEEQRRSHGN